MTRRAHDEQLDDAEMSELYLHHAPRRRVATTDCYYLARQTEHGPEQYGIETRGETLDVCRRALEALMADPPEDRDPSLCVVHVPGQWRDAEVVLTAEEVSRCPGCGAQGNADLCDACGKGAS